MEPSQLTPTPSGNKGTKSKGKTTEIHFNFCGKNGHMESKCFNKMEALEATMKKNKNNLDPPSNSFSHRHVHFYFCQ
jgi:hypothetical protein